MHTVKWLPRECELHKQNHSVSMFGERYPSTRQEKECSPNRCIQISKPLGGEGRRGMCVFNLYLKELKDSISSKNLQR